MSAQAFLPIKAANIVILGVCCCTALELSMMQDQISLMLRWRSFSVGGSDIIAGLCAHKGGQFCDYGSTLSHSRVIIQDARSDIGDTPLTLISRMGKRACRLAFYFSSRSITPLWIDVTMHSFDCHKDQTKIVHAPLTVTLETYLQSFGAQWFCIIFLQ